MMKAVRKRALLRGNPDPFLPGWVFLLLKSMCLLAALFFAIHRGEDIKKYMAAAKRNMPEMREIVQDLDREEKRSIHDFYSFRTYKK